jgi:uncharacterized membrane protein
VNYNPYAAPQAPATPPPPPSGFGPPQPWTTSDALRVAWERFKVHGGILILAHFTYTALVVVLGQVANVPVWLHVVDINTPAYFGVLGGGTVFTQVLAAFFNVGLTRMWLDVARGVPPKFETLFSGGDRFLPMLGLNIVFGIAVAVGCVLFIVPGVLMMLTYQFAPYYVVEGRMGPIEALQKSWEVSAGQRLEVLVLVLAGVGLSLLGIVMCCLGWLVTVPIYWVATAVAFTRVAGMSVAPIVPPGPVQLPYPGPPHNLPPWQ